MDTQKAHQGQKIPSYGLYGEPLTSSPVFMHIEPIEVRSRAFNGEFGAHLHQNLHQVTWLVSGQLDVRVNDYRRTLKGPSALMVPALAVHSSHAAKDTDGFVLTVRQEFFHCSESRVASEIFKRFVAIPAVFTLAPHADMTTDTDDHSALDMGQDAHLQDVSQKAPLSLAIFTVTLHHQQMVVA